MYQRVLVPLDGSRVAEAILPFIEQIAGPLDMENELNEFRDRIEILPRVSRDKYYGNVYKCHINLVPLELGNPFCESKSEIKFMSSAARIRFLILFFWSFLWGKIEPSPVTLFR